MSMLGIDSGINVNEGFFQKKEVKTGIVIAGIVAAAVLGAFLISSGLGQYSFSEKYFHWLTPNGVLATSGKPWVILSDFDMGKNIALLTAGGALVGVAAFGIKKLIYAKVENRLDKKEEVKTLHTKKALHRLDSAIAVAAIVASIIILSIAIVYMAQQVKVTDTQVTMVWSSKFCAWMPDYSFNSLGYAVWKPGIMRAALGLIAGGSLATFGLLTAGESLYRRIEHKVRPIPDSFDL